jgi:hypothetical protein
VNTAPAATAIPAPADTSKAGSVPAQATESPALDSAAEKRKVKTAAATAEDGPKTKQKDKRPVDSDAAKAKKKTTAPENSKAKSDTTTKNDSEPQ